MSVQYFLYDENSNETMINFRMIIVLVIATTMFLHDASHDDFDETIVRFVTVHRKTRLFYKRGATLLTFLYNDYAVMQLGILILSVIIEKVLAARY